MSQRSYPSEFAILRQQAGLSVSEAALNTGYAERTVYRWESGEAQPRRAVLDLLRVAKRSTDLLPESSTFRFIDLFAGIGGLRRGFEKIGGECVFTSEWDKYAQKTYRAVSDRLKALMNDPEFDIAGKQRVGANDDIDVARIEPGFHRINFLAAHEP